jgi:adenine deaminase
MRPRLRWITRRNAGDFGSLGYVGDAKRRHDEFRRVASSNLARGRSDRLCQDLGSIEVGKLADLIVLVENPLEDIRNTNTIKYVMKNGELFEGDTLKQIWPQQKTPPRMWWWDEQQ